MNFKTYYESLDAAARDKLATAVNSKVVYLSQIAYGHRNPSHSLAKAIEKATKKAVQKHELRPDIFDAPRKGRAA